MILYHSKQFYCWRLRQAFDALAVGISFAFLKVDILQAITMIGIITFVLSFLAVIIGNRLGNMLEKYAGILGGCILILIGCKILIEHLFFKAHRRFFIFHLYLICKLI